MSILKFSKTLLATLGATFLTISAHAGIATYTYTAPIGGPFNNTGVGSFALYGALDGSGIKFDFTVAAPLVSKGCAGASYNVNCNANVLGQVLSWHYHGGNSFMNTGSDLGGTLTGLALSTLANGQVQDGRFYLNGPVVIPTLEAFTSSIAEAHDGYDQANLFSNYLRQYSTGIHSEPLYTGLSEGFRNTAGSGHWTMTEAVTQTSNDVPEPQTFILVLAALALVGATTRRKATAKTKPKLA